MESLYPGILKDIVHDENAIGNTGWFMRSFTLGCHVCGQQSSYGNRATVRSSYIQAASRSGYPGLICDQARPTSCSKKSYPPNFNGRLDRLRYFTGIPILWNHAFHSLQRRDGYRDSPAFVLPIAALILGERITLQRIIALTLSTVGVLVVVNPLRSSIEQGYMTGNLCLVTAALTWALYSVLVRKMTANYDVLTFSMYAFLGGLPVSVSLGVWELTQQSIGTLTWGILGGILFLGIICTALAMFLWNTAFKHLDAGIAGLTFFAQPLVGAALGALLLHDKLSLSFIFGGVLILGGILFSSRQN